MNDDLFQWLCTGFLFLIFVALLIIGSSQSRSYELLRRLSNNQMSVNMFLEQILNRIPTPSTKAKKVGRLTESQINDLLHAKYSREQYSAMSKRNKWWLAWDNADEISQIRMENELSFEVELQLPGDYYMRIQALLKSYYSLAGEAEWWRMWQLGDAVARRSLEDGLFELERRVTSHL